VAGTSNRRSRRRSSRWIGALAVVVIVVGFVVVRSRLSHPPAVTPTCVATVGTVSYPLDPAQAANATTIAAVGKRLGLPDHAVTVALAAALQESGLRNLDGGDRDSLGLFQQRPSQGWGSPADIMVPRLSAEAFYRHLEQVPDWETLSVTDAAQAVQQSAAPDAYAQQEAEARLLARVLTGEVAAGLTCRYQTPSKATDSASVTEALQTEVGEPATGTTVDSARGWLVASWLLGHGDQFGVDGVTFDGQRWTPSSGRWRAHPPAVPSVEL
jgi:hypothetical protein